MKIKDWVFTILLLLTFGLGYTHLLGYSNIAASVRAILVPFSALLYLSYAFLQLKSLSSLLLKIGVPLSTTIIVLLIFEQMHWPLGPFLWMLGGLGLTSCALLVMELIKRVMDSFTSTVEVSALGAVIIANGGYLLYYLDLVHFESFIYYDILSVVLIVQVVRLICANKETPVGQAVRVLALFNVGLSLISLIKYLD
jgi:hypothetical protein